MLMCLLWDGKSQMFGMDTSAELIMSM